MNQKRMSKGNLKIDKSVSIFSLPAIESCLNCKDCAKTCYARKAERRPNVIKFRRKNFDLAKNDRPLLKSLIQAQLKPGDIVRIHESGDFFSQEYLDFWYEIVSENPEVRFYGYTKVKEILDFSKIDVLQNINIINSILPDGSINYGPLEYMLEKAQKFQAFACPCGQSDTARCMNTCFACLAAPIVVFLEH